MPVTRAVRRCGAAGLGALALGSAVAAGTLAGGRAAGMPEAVPPPSRAVLAADTVRAFDALAGGPHPGWRAAHARGVLAEGAFVPAEGADRISAAPHLRGAATRVLVRFSNAPGSPDVADGAPGSGPRGMAIKFLLADGGETDIVAHSYDGFPAATPEGFLAFLRASADPAALAALAAREPAVRRFLDTPLPAPAGYGTQAYFGVNAFRFTNAAGRARYGRYRIEPMAGERHLDRAEAAARAPDYLRTDLAARLGAGPVRFRLALQLADEGDDVADGSRPWPADRPVVTLGTLSLDRLADDQGRQRTLLFTPLSLVEGIAASDDPLLGARTRTYRISHERRAARAPDAASGAGER